MVIESNGQELMSFSRDGYGVVGVRVENANSGVLRGVMAPPPFRGGLFHWNANHGFCFAPPVATSCRPVGADRVVSAGRFTQSVIFLGCIVSAILASSNRVVVADLPRETARLIEEGNKFFEQGEFAKALDAFDRAAARSPESAEIAFNRGVTMYRLGDFDKAQTAFQDALRPERPDLEARAKYNLARTAHAAALSKPDEPQTAVKDLGRAIDFYKDTLSLRPDSDARHNLDLAQRMQLFLQKQLEEMKKEQEKQQSDSDDSSSQPSEDQKSPSSQPSPEQNEPSSQPQDQQSEGQEQQGEKQDGGKSSQSDQEQEGEPQDSESADDSESKDGEQNEGEENAPEETESEEQSQSEQSDSKEGDENESESDQTEGQPEQAPSPASQPSDSTEQEEAATTMPATSQPSGKFDARDISKQHALRLLDEVRQSERKRRELLKARALQRRGRIPVEKDW